MFQDRILFDKVYELYINTIRNKQKFVIYIKNAFNNMKQKIINVFFVMTLA